MSVCISSYDEDQMSWLPSPATTGVKAVVVIGALTFVSAPYGKDQVAVGQSPLVIHAGEGTAPSSHLDELLDLAPQGTTADQLASWGRSMIGGDTSHMLDL